MADFAKRLKELRIGRGLRQKDLAAALGLAQTTIANYEQKQRFPDEAMLVKIADYFTVSLDQLMGRENGIERLEGQARVDEVLPGRAPLQPLAVEYLRLLRVEGKGAALARLRQAVAEGAGIREIYLHVFEPALKEAGRLWSAGELSVGEEHAISEATQQLMSEMQAGVGEPRSASGRPRCVSLAAGGERHVIGARMVADFLSFSGWDVDFLGGNLSIGHILEALAAKPPALLALSVTLEEHLNAARDLIDAVRASRRLAGMKIMVGGQAFRFRPLAWKELRADGMANDAEEAVKTAARLVGDRG